MCPGVVRPDAVAVQVATDQALIVAPVDKSVLVGVARHEQMPQLHGDRIISVVGHVPGLPRASFISNLPQNWQVERSPPLGPRWRSQPGAVSAHDLFTVMSAGTPG